MIDADRVLLVVIAVAALVFAVLGLATDVALGSERTMDAGQNLVISVLSLSLAWHRR